MAFGSSRSLFSLQAATLAQRKKPRVANRTQYVAQPTRATTTRSLTRGLTLRMPSGRPTVTMRPRPGININGGVMPTVVAAGGVMPQRAATAGASGGALALPSGADLGLGEIGAQISSSVSGVVGQVKNLIPTAIKIIGVVIIIKIVLWLVRGRRR